VCVQLLPEEEDDLWHAYNLIAVGDTLQAVTVRWVLRLRGACLLRFWVQLTRCILAIHSVLREVQGCLGLRIPALALWVNFELLWISFHDWYWEQS
jgi:hypothetical protein